MALNLRFMLPSAASTMTLISRMGWPPGTTDSGEMRLSIVVCWLVLPRTSLRNHTRPRLSIHGMISERFPLVLHDLFSDDRSMDHFDHEKLEVYQVAISFVGIADDIVDNLPVGRSYLADQLHRAAASISNNIAEGAGEFAPKEKKRFYRMARRSATECRTARCPSALQTRRLQSLGRGKTDAPSNRLHADATRNSEGDSATGTVTENGQGHVQQAALQRPADMDRPFKLALPCIKILFWLRMKPTRQRSRRLCSTVDHSDMRGSKPHGHDPSGAASD